MCGASWHHHHGYHRSEHCCPPGGWVRGFLQPQLLLSLLREPTHGYELMERLADEEESPFVDPGLLYRTLRRLEEDGVVSSSWDTQGPGPARRLYEVTPQGIDYLHAWVARIRATRERLDRFLAEYEAQFRSTEER